jgi:hypothetical protein
MHTTGRDRHFQYGREEIRYPDRLRHVLDFEGFSRRTHARRTGRPARGDYGGEAIWLLDRDSKDTFLVSDSETHTEHLAWAPDGDQLFATSYSYGETRTAVWRYQVGNQEFSSVVLPFGGALSLVVVESTLADAYLGDELVDPTECRGAGNCTFEF